MGGAVRITRLALTLHKWLALVIGVQVLLWFASGLFFTAVPIERVRSEHLRREPPPVPVALAEIGPALARLPVGDADKVEVRALLGRPVALVSRGEARPRLFDLRSDARLSPLTRAHAAAIARAHYAGSGRPVEARWVSAESPEYRGVLPAWRVRFDDGASLALYVAADTGAVTAARSRLWRAYDFLWGLHIMDWRAHENFNTPWAVAVSAFALVLTLSGFWLLPRALRRRGRNARGGRAVLRPQGDRHG